MNWNVWVDGRKVNRNPLTEAQARKMAALLKFNYNQNAKVYGSIKTND